MSYYQYIFLVPLLPFFSFLLLGLFGRKSWQGIAGHMATTSLLFTTVLSLLAAYQYFFVEGKEGGVYQKIIAAKMTWLQFSPSLSIEMGFLLDPISMMMIVVVSLVSLMVHLFSLGYMKGEKRFSTYFAFLGLFTASMLGLVLSSNLFQIYIFWELVGLSSYLLIGFYYERPTAVAASKKAFIVTRFADLGFLIGILILGFYGGSLDFATLLQRLTDTQSPQAVAITTGSFLGISALTWGLSLIFMGGAGKSAMFPLHIWLPDAMEGPTPVSALIHAATMVVAGIYLVARLFPLFAIDVPVMAMVTWVGVLSALLAAIIACTQTDIKRVLAYSTMSQIGFMMFALGVSGGNGTSGYTASFFHLFTHAFFKSLLFLGAGAIIHDVHSNELRDMGGLRKSMPVTHASFLIACFAIAGLPPFAGFFSKEAILLTAYESNMTVYVLALATSALTAFYMFRLYFSIFWQKEATAYHYHPEGTASMKVPLMILSLLSVAAGFVPFSSFITVDGVPARGHFSPLFAALPVGLSVSGILLAAYLYKRSNEKPARIAALFGRLYKAAVGKFYIDELYLFFTRKILFSLIGRPAAWFDRHVVDGAMNGLARVTASTSNLTKGWQSGHVQQYTLWFFSGVAGLAVLFIYVWK